MVIQQINNVYLTIFGLCFILLEKLKFVLVNFFGSSIQTIERGAAVKNLTEASQALIPKSVNYHFTRRCNYECGFCFHTAKTSFMLDLEEAKRGLLLLKNAGLEKINFSGGEPFLPNRGRHLGEMVKFCKVDLQLPSVTVVTNGSMVTEKWFKKYGEFLDIMAVSCDSFDENINNVIGRRQNGKNHLEQLFKIGELCKKYKVLFKINTVVNTYNYEENMNHFIAQLSPVRWKVFQCLLLEGENAGPDALRNAERFYIDNNKFDEFINRHKDLTCLVPESNEKMQNSYLILDEYMRFLDCTEGSKKPSKSILDVGVNNALKFSGFDEIMFLKRGGKYKWSKKDADLTW